MDENDVKRLTCIVCIAIVIVAGVLLCQWWPSAGPLAAAPVAPVVRWTPRGALVTWHLDTATTVTLSRCRSQVGCWLLYNGAEEQFLDNKAITGDQYSLGRFIQDDGALTIVGWSSATLTGGRTWLPVAGRWR